MAPAVRIDMGAAAGYLAGTPGCLDDGALGRGLDPVVDELEPLPSDRSFGRIVYDAPLNGALARKGHANKGIAPGGGAPLGERQMKTGKSTKKRQWPITMRSNFRSCC